MFSENQKISKRQISRLLIYDLLGITTLLLPTALVNIAGADGIFCIFLALLPAYVYLIVLKRIQHRVDKDYLAYIETVCGKVIMKIVGIFYFLFCIFLAGYTVFLLSNVIAKSLLKEESYWLIAISILVLGGYGVLEGIEGRARVYELLFWFLLIPLIIMLILAAGDVNVDYWTPVFTTGLWDIGRGIALVFAFYAITFSCLFLIPFEKKQGNAVISAKIAIIIMAMLNSIIFLILLGMFGKKSLGVMDYPIITLMSMIKMPGGFFERQDAFMVGIWFFALYALINSGMFYGNEIIKRVINRNGNKRYIAVTLLLTFMMAAMFYRSQGAIQYYQLFLTIIGIPAIILIPLLVYAVDRGKNRG